MAMPVLIQRFQAAVDRRLAQLPGLNRSRLAERMGVKPSYISQYLLGYSSPGLDVIERFAEALDCDPSELLQPEPPPSEQHEAATKSVRHAPRKKSRRRKLAV